MKQPVTIYTIVDMFRDICNRHGLIRMFKFGPDEHFDGKSLEFPLLWMVPTSSTITPSTGVNMASYTIQVFIADRVNKDASNYIEAISQSDYTANTIYAELRGSKFTRENGIEISVANKTFEVSEWDEDVNGVDMSFNISFPSRISKCNSPIEPVCVPLQPAVPTPPVVPDPNQPQ